MNQKILIVLMHPWNFGSPSKSAVWLHACETKKSGKDFVYLRACQNCCGSKLL